MITHKGGVATVQECAPMFSREALNLDPSAKYREKDNPTQTYVALRIADAANLDQTMRVDWCERVQARNGAQ